jgi:hypothetical protein
VTKADPFDMGGGRIAPNRALDPGLAYEADLLDYLAASCGTDTPLISPEECDQLFNELGFTGHPSDLNLPSIGADSVLGSRLIQRRVTNVSDEAATYNASIVNPPGFRVTVDPASLTLDPGETAAFEILIEHRTAPAGEWRFGSLNWSDGTHNVYSPIAANATTVAAPEEVAGGGADGSAAMDVTFGFNGTYTTGAHGLVEPFLTLVEVADDPADTFGFDFGDDEPLVYLFEAPEGATALQFSLFDAYNDQPDHDLDLYVFYCPDFVCTQVAASFNVTSNEQVRIPFPLNDPAIDDPYAVFVHGFNTAGSAVASGIFFDWTAEDAVGNLTVDPESTTVGVGETLEVTANWSDLLTGPAEKWFGAVSHSDEAGIQDLTYVSVENDEGGGYCDLVECN